MPGSIRWSPLTSGYWEHVIPADEWHFDSSITLNTNYGLNYNVKVNNDTRIYKEITYRHRQYFVNGNEKLYMSHIAGSGLAQPDSFPYNKEVEFGYLLTEENAVNIGLAVTPLDEVIIFTENKSYVYYMQITNSSVVRKIKAVNGSVGLTSANALPLDFSGHSEGMNLFWIDKQGAYLYAGGRNEPKSVTNGTHRNYWLNLSNDLKSNAVVSYNRMKREYWIILENTIIIFEESYGTFKKYKFDFNIKEVIGTSQDKFYLLGNDGKMYVIDYKSTNRLDGYVITHESTNTIIIGQYPISSWEWQHKILQDLYVAFKNNTSGYLDYTIIADETELEVIKLSTDMLRETVTSPLLVRYGKIAIKLFIPSTITCIKEFGYSFSIPSQGVGDLQLDKASGIGQSVGTHLGQNQ
jgi:hypothetical protein